MINVDVARYFVADVHLSDAAPGITARFALFLRKLPDNCELYILGDLFDYWLGDDIKTILNSKVADWLRSLTSRGISVFFIRGNRDFLLGEQYAHFCKMTILPDMYTLAHNGKHIVITHGDILCGDDKIYLFFRTLIRSRLLSTLFLLLPFRLRGKIANALRLQSKQRNKRKSVYKMESSPDALLALIKKYNADILIQGHTHKAGHSHLVIMNKSVELFVLGAWHDNSDYVVAAETIELRS